MAEDQPLPPERTDSASAPSLETLYRACSDRLSRFFARRTGREDALDLVHDAFVRLAGLDETAASAINKPEAYLGRIATNLLRDRARSAARRALDAQGASDSLAAPHDPQRLLEDRDALARLEAAVDRLGARRRRIFLLHRIEGLTYAQIGEEVGMSVKGVKKQMARALFELRRDAGPL